MRTERSNLCRFIVHFFDTRQRNEPKKTCVRGVHSPYVSPGLCALCTYGPKVVREAASLLFLGVGEKGKGGRGGPWSSRSIRYLLFIIHQRSGFIIHFSFGAGAPYGHCCLFIQNRIAKNSIYKFSQKFLTAGGPSPAKKTPRHRIPCLGVHTMYYALPSPDHQ